MGRSLFQDKSTQSRILYLGKLVGPAVEVCPLDQYQKLPTGKGKKETLWGHVGWIREAFGTWSKAALFPGHYPKEIEKPYQHWSGYNYFLFVGTGVKSKNKTSGGRGERPSFCPHTLHRIAVEEFKRFFVSLNWAPFRNRNSLTWTPFHTSLSKLSEIPNIAAFIAQLFLDLFSFHW